MILDRMSLTSPGPKLKWNGLSYMPADGRPGVGSTSESTSMKSTFHNIHGLSQNRRCSRAQATIVVVGGS